MNNKTLRALEYKKVIDMLCDKTTSSLGRRLAENLLPSKDITDIEMMQRETEEALSMTIKRGNIPLGAIYDVSNELKRAKIGAMLSPGELLKIADSIRSARNIKNFIKEDKDEKKYKQYELIIGMINELNVYKDIEDNIYNAIISEEGISDNASPALRSIRRQVDIKNGAIRDKLNGIINSSEKKKYLQEGIITIRNDRYVVPVKQEYKGKFPGLVHDQSSSGATLFIEPMAVVQLNNQLKELKAKERTEIEKILSELTEIVNFEAEGISENQKLLAQLDFIFAKGKLAVDMNAIRPLLNSKGYINIKQGRHPMIDKTVVVPIDIYFGDEFTSLVITGPNTGGKTVTLKTVGLFSLMTQSGLHIPANHGSEMAVFNNVFADIGDEQSIEQSLSTFSSHMTNIVQILKNISNNSLVLFDELGAGTDPTEGAALAMSILNYLYDKGIRTIATTHYSELKLYAIETEGIENASVEFDIKTLSPTYRLLVGVPGKSNAFEISKRLGLDNFVIENAKKLISKENIEFEDILSKIEQDRKVSRENKEETERLKLEVEQLKGKLKEKEERLQKNKERILKDARIKAKDILKRAKSDADDIIKEIRDVSIEIEKEKNKKIQESRDKLSKDLKEIESDLVEDIFTKENSKPPKDLKKGESVRILNLNQVGTVLTEPDDDGNVLVQVGIMKINVNITTLKREKDNEKHSMKVKTKGMIRSKAKAIKTELDLRGTTLEEAMLDVDKYLDDAYMAGLNQVSIIHGKGTGVLRSGIKQLLKGHRHVRDFRLGNYREGGTGVTIVELR